MAVTGMKGSRIPVTTSRKETVAPPPSKLKIYTDWANHYLEKARNKRYISDLQQDVSDGVLLADVIEAVTSEKILDIKTKPKNSAQMVENINTCLTFLANLGVNVEGLNAKDIKDGNLKSILSLFFNLSRYKQQQKSQQQQQQHKDQHQRPHLGETTNTNQTNGDDVQSRLPSYKQQNSKCPITAHPGTSIKDSSNSTTGCSKSSSAGNTSGSGSKGRSQSNAQNNNLPSTAGADSESTTSSRATSPACSGIPTPGGRGLTSRSQEKQQSRTVQSQSSNSSIPTPSKSSSPKSGSSSISGSANKNSMLDKFKLFNSKDKGKSKGGSSKGLSKASSSASSASAPSTSSRSDTDSKSSTSLQSSSSTDPGASLSPQDGEPPKLPAKTKSSAFTGPKRENSGLTVPPEPTLRQGSPSPSFGVSSSATGSLSSTKKSLSAKSPKNDSKAAPVDAKSAAQSSSSTQSLTRPPKVGSLIPKTSIRTSKSSSSSSLSSQGALGSGIPTPTSSIPKPATAKVSKPSKEEKMKAVSTAVKEQDRNGNNMQSMQNQSIPVTKKSSKSMQGMAQQQQAQQIILQQQQQMAHLQQQQQHPPPVPPHRNNCNKAAQFTSCSDHSISQTRSQTPQEQLSRPQDGRSTFPKTRYTEIEYSDGKIERVGEGHLSKSSQAAALSQVMDLHGTTIPQKVSASHPAYHLVTTASQSVNVVKPTCSTAYNPVMKADGNTQTALTVLHRGNRPPPLPTTEPPPSRHKKLESPKEGKAQSDTNTSETATHFANSSSSGNNSASSSETEAAKTGTEEKSEPAEVSSPRLGVKALVPQTGRPANNVAIVQPRHGEKIETTFDTEVRTEMINKGNVSKDGKQGKETTFSEKKATFVDDSGETMDIQPMAPIMRAMPYGYYRSISSQSPNTKHYQTPVVTLPSGTYALATTAGSRLGMSRTFVDQGRFYSGPIKRAMSSGSGSVPFDADYCSDYDTYDYISGYMSDGDILKRNNMDDMTSGYMSEGGASMYARRLQQRFREGMQAVKECMQKSSGLIDDDSFDDSSSISSGDISDTINEISTDEGNLTGGSSQSDTHPYASLKHGPRDLFRNLTNENLHGVLPGKRVPNLGTSAFMGTDYASDSGGGYGGSASGWRKYSLQNNRLLSSDPADYAYLYNGYDSMQWRNQDGSRPLRKLSNASQPEIHYRSASTNGDYAGEHCSDSNSLKRDSETNTDQSHLYEASLRKLHSMQSPRLQSGGGVGYGYRRPLSNVSTSSVGSNRSSGGSKGSSSVGTRLAMYSNTTSKLGSEHNGVPSPAGTTQNMAANQESGPDAFVSASLERNKKGGNPVSKSSSSAQTDADMYKSNSLGRRKGIGVKGPLIKTAAGESGNICGSTIISNPHATFSKGDPRGQPNPYSSVNIPGISGSSSTGNYVSLEYVRGMGPAWLRTSGGNINNYGVHSPYGHLSDSETIDGLSAYASSIQAQIQQARALSGASARILAQQRGEYGQSGLQRSNSMRSTQSDSVYASFQHCHTDDLAMTNSYSQLPSPPPPSSPTPSNSSHASSRFTFPMTTYNSNTTAAVNPSLSQNMVRSNTSSSLPYGNMGLAKLNKEDEESLHGSSLSLVSSSSSVYSTAEEKQNHEIRKLKRDLEAAQEKVSTLTTQLSTNAHVVAAFEQSLSNMTSRLQHLTATAEQKDTELNDLRATIEALKRQSGLSIPDPMLNANVGRRHTTPGMVGKDLVQGGRPQFHTLPMPNEARITRQISSDSMSSINSMSSACSMTSQQSAATDGELCKKKKKKGWLRSSFSKAFSGKKKNKNGSLSDVEPDTTSLRSTLSVPNSPLLQVHMQNGSGLIKGSHSSGALCEGDDTITVSELKKLLRDKDMKLTDIRLEALSSAHQLEQLRETMNKMKTEMGALKADNDRLQKLICSKGLNTSQNSLVQHSRSSSDSLERTVSLTEQTSLDLLLHESNDREGRRVTITVYLGSNPDPIRTKKPPEVLIGSLSVSGKTKWDILDNINRKIFKEYVLRIDPVTNLGLSSESVFSYHIGEIVRTKVEEVYKNEGWTHATWSFFTKERPALRLSDSEPPELLPIGYLVGDTMQIGICLKGTKQNSVDSLAFETLIPKSIIQRYISLLMEHRRIILCGPSGTGKTYLAQKLAEHLVLRSGKELTAGSVATFNVDHKSAKELRSYLANIADQCENTSAGELPSVIILDNLHHVSSLGEVFNGFLSVKYQKCPYIIGTMNQATCSTTNLQLHHNFRWVLCANHMEPVKGFLGRFLRRKLVEAEVMTSMRNNDLNNIIDWVPKVWMHINKLLETHSSSDVTIGPRLFLSCPMDIAASKLWFTDLWNYSIVPYMIEAVREGLQVYGRRAPWEDPSEWVRETYPWSLGKDEEQILLRIRPEDVGYDTVGILSSDNSSPKIKNKGDTTTDSEGDPMVSDV